MNLINFPTSLPEEEKIKICKMLDEKDQEISKLYQEIIVLENNIERFNGGLNYKDAENLRTQMGINNAKVAQIETSLKSFNLRAVEFQDPKNPNVFPIKLIRITFRERFKEWLKSLIKFKIVKTS